MGKVLKPETLEQIIQMSLLYGKTREETAQAVGCSSVAVCRTVDIFKLVQTQDWGTLVYKIGTSHYGEPTVKWASEQLGVLVPQVVWDAFDDARAVRETNRVLPEQTVLPMEEPKKDNDAVYLIRILEELTKTNELLTQLMDVVLPHYVSDIKDSIGVNADIIRADVGEVVKNTECIKNNTRKRGL